MGETEANRLALVTGGSRGIGAAISKHLAAAGAAVLVAARDEAACAGVVDEIEEAGGVAWPLRLDVTSPESITVALENVHDLASALTPIDWLVNNAGIAVSGPLLPRDEPAARLYQEHLDVNFHGPRRLVEALVPEMKHQGYGRVVNVASSAGLRGYAYVAAYSASKHALVGYTLSAAEELAKSGVTFNALCPHYVDTPMLERSIEKLVSAVGLTEKEALEHIRSENPGGQLITPDEVAVAALALLAGDANGTLVELDGSPEARILTPNRRGR